MEAHTWAKTVPSIGAVTWLATLRQRKRLERLFGIKFPGLDGVNVDGFYGNFTTDAEGDQVILWDWT